MKHHDQPSHNTCDRQRSAILRRLSQGPATVAELMHDCHAPDPRKRISELRRDGHEIDSHEIERPNGDGTVNRVRVYALRSESQTPPLTLEQINRAARSVITNPQSWATVRFSRATENYYRKQLAILQRLLIGPVTDSELMQDFRADDPQSWINGLRREGYQIEARAIGRQGFARHVRAYFLKAPGHVRAHFLKSLASQWMGSHDN